VKRLRHIVWNGLAVVSALLCVAILVAWSANLRWEMFVCHTSLSPHGKNFYWLDRTLLLQDGLFVLNSTSAETTTHNHSWIEDPRQWIWGIRPAGAYGQQLMGFPANLRPYWEVVPNWAMGREVIQSRITALCVPYWMCVAVLAPMPMFQLRRYWRNRRRARRLTKGTCPFCGYDLRATSGRCQECGQAIQGGSTNE
jgi:hypothetical protein